MEMTKCKYHIRCELGACGKPAAYTIRPSRAGIMSNLHICADCLADIVMIGMEMIDSTVKGESV